MSDVMLLGHLEGGSALLADGEYCGEVRHSIRVYRDARRDTILAAGRIWGDDMVLRRATVGQMADLLLEDGQTVRVVVRQRSADSKSFCIGVDGAVPGY